MGAVSTGSGARGADDDKVAMQPNATAHRDPGGFAIQLVLAMRPRR